MSNLVSHEHRVPPVRGLIALQNRKGRYYARIDILRWLRLNRFAYKTSKIDILFQGPAPSAFPLYLDAARDLGMLLSLRTDCSGPPPDLAELRDKGLFDVFLTPLSLGDPHVDDWCTAARNANLPIRMQLQPPFSQALDAQGVAEVVTRKGPRVVNLAVYDPFLMKHHADSQPATDATIRLMNDAANLIEREGVETNLLHLPYCAVDEPNRIRAANWRMFFRDHQHYVKESYEFARKLYDRPPFLAGKAVEMLLGKYTLFDNPIDNKLLPWIVESPWLRARVVAFHKVTRHLRLTRSVPRPVEDSAEAHEAALQQKRYSMLLDAGPICGKCRYRIICDHAPEPVVEVLSGLEIHAQAGDTIGDPLQVSRFQKKYYDEIDAERRLQPDDLLELAEQANAVVRDRPYDREIDSYAYAIEGQWCHQLPGGVRWYGFTNTEKVSTPLATLSPPFTLSAIFGGGIAEYIGFSLGRHAKLLCPMEAYRHQLVLHVDRDGRYVLLRDGKPLTPVNFEGAASVPLRLSGVLEPRLSVWNVDNTLVTQNVLLWEGGGVAPAPAGIKYSVVTVSIRYARRLQAVLRSVIEQEGFDRSKLEIVVAHVPGLDGSEDVLDSLALAYPGVRIVRSTFDEEDASAKGFMINESLEKASGEWVVLLDADTLVPPNFFASLEAQENGAKFIVPDGRKLLDKAATAKVLTGIVEPWREWDTLLNQDGEFRYREMEGVPIGFCQCVRKSCFEKVKYYEVDHFEGADWQFSVDMRKTFGHEQRLSGVPVLHLDHGGSKWYGSQYHF